MRKFGQGVNPSGREFGQPGSLTVDRPSLLERRQAVTQVADSQRQDRNLYRRTFRGLKKRLRNGDTRSGLLAIKLNQEGQAAGHQMSGIVSADGATNTAVRTLKQQQDVDQEMSSLATRHDQALIPGQGVEANGASGNAPPALGTGPADGGNMQRENTGSSILARRGPSVSPIPSSIKPVSSVRSPGQTFSAPVSPEELQAVGASALSVEDQNARNEERRVDQFVRGAKQQSAQEAFNEGDKLSRQLELLKKYQGDLDFADIPEEDREGLEEARDFQQFQQEEKEFGRAKAMKLAQERARVRAWQDITTRAQERVRGNT